MLRVAISRVAFLLGECARDAICQRDVLERRVRQAIHAAGEAQLFRHAARLARIALLRGVLWIGAIRVVLQYLQVSDGAEAVCCLANCHLASIFVCRARGCTVWAREGARFRILLYPGQVLVAVLAPGAAKDGAEVSVGERLLDRVVGWDLAIEVGVGRLDPVVSVVALDCAEPQTVDVFVGGAIGALAIHSPAEVFPEGGFPLCDALCVNGQVSVNVLLVDLV